MEGEGERAVRSSREGCRWPRLSYSIECTPARSLPAAVFCHSTISKPSREGGQSEARFLLFLSSHFSLFSFLFAPTTSTPGESTPAHLLLLGRAELLIVKRASQADSLSLLSRSLYSAGRSSLLLPILKRHLNSVMLSFHPFSFTSTLLCSLVASSFAANHQVRVSELRPG